MEQPKRLRQASTLVAGHELPRHRLPEPVDERRQRILISYRRGSAEGRQALRDADVSFVGADGRLFLRAPGIFVDRDERTQPALEEGMGVERDVPGRNPFAKRSSRIPRWLLLHPAETFSVGELANAVNLNPAATSRVLHALEDSALIGDVKPGPRGPRRSIRLERPRALLETWLPFWQCQRIRKRRWDIGARSVEEALEILGKAADSEPISWSIGGLAGAAMIRRSVEPAEILVWSNDHGVEALAHALVLAPVRDAVVLVGAAALEVALADARGVAITPTRDIDNGRAASLVVAMVLRGPSRSCPRAGAALRTPIRGPICAH